MVTNLSMQKRMMRLGSLILLLALCMSLFTGCGNGKRQAQQNGNYPTTTGKVISAVYNDTLYLADSNGNIHTTPFEHDFRRQKTSFDGTKMFGTDNDNRLVYFDGTTLKHIADGAYNVDMSADGNVLIYEVSGNGERVSDLYRYSDGKSTYIASGIICETVVSPDGSAIGYTVVSDASTYDSYYWDESGEIKFVGYKKRVMGISNHAEYIYYEQYGDKTSSPDSAWVQSGSSDSFSQTCIDADGGSYTRISFNSDGTEILFWGEDGYACISVKGSEPIRICDQECGLMVPAETRSSSLDGNRVYYDIDSFAGNFFCPRPTYENPQPTYPLVYVGDNFEVYSVVNHPIDYVYLCNDRKTCFYETDGALYKFDGSVPKEPPVKLFDGRDFYVTNNGREILYIKDDSLFRADGTRRNAQPIQIHTSAYGLDHRVAYAATGRNANEILYSFGGAEVLYQFGKGQSILVPESMKGYRSSVAEFKGFMYFCIGGNLYRLEKGEPVRIEGIESCDYILAGRHMIITFTGESPYDYCAKVQNTYTPVGYDTPNYAGCYFSVDGVNFMPLVENYVAEAN